LATGRALSLGTPLAQLVGGEDVVEAEHPLRVLDGRQVARGRPPDVERRRVLPLQLWVQSLELLQTAHPGVVRRIVDQRGVAVVVGVARLLDACDELLRLGPRLLE